jgi:hypothetical protein
LIFVIANITTHNAAESALTKNPFFIIKIDEYLVY